MRTLTNQKLLLDADCPMCRLYGQVFEHTQMIARGTCYPYQTADTSVCEPIDMARARNEIALLNTQTQTVVYGVDAFRAILSHSFPKIQYLIDPLLLRWFWQKLYRFVSTNRKVIAPSAIVPHRLDCRPDLNVKYRIAYLLTTVLITAGVLSAFCKPIYAGMGWQAGMGLEVAVCGGQVLWQGVWLRKYSLNKYFDYLCNMMTVSLVGALLLLPLSWLGHLVAWPFGGWVLAFAIVLGLMFLEHLRRCHLLGLGSWPTVSWVFYRIVVLTLFYLFL